MGVSVMRLIMYKGDKIVKVVEASAQEDITNAIVEAVETLGVDRIVVIGGDK